MVLGKHIVLLLFILFALMHNVFMKVETGVKLSDFSNYKTGGLADYFIVAKSEDDIKQALLFAKEKNLKFFILAGGTNVLFPDDGFRGLVIKIGIDDFKIDSVKITAGAGVVAAAANVHIRRSRDDRIAAERHRVAEPVLDGAIQCGQSGHLVPMVGDGLVAIKHVGGARPRELGRDGL